MYGENKIIIQKYEGTSALLRVYVDWKEGPISKTCISEHDDMNSFEIEQQFI